MSIYDDLDGRVAEQRVWLVKATYRGGRSFWEYQTDERVAVLYSQGSVGSWQATAVPTWRAKMLMKASRLSLVDVSVERVYR